MSRRLCARVYCTMFDESIYIRKGAYLPHWTKEGAIYHVRFRLFDSLPQEILKSLIEEREELTKKVKSDKKLIKSEQMRFNEVFSEKIEQYLDAGYGSCWLQREDIAQIIVNALCKYEGSRYKLYAWCIMPNHVHVIVQPQNYQLHEILRSWKGSTARYANQLLSRSGQFWQMEYFDHLIRNSDGFASCIEYVWKNPEDAGFKNWRWRWKKI
jgi:REP element-mobilizing transposase RayT